MTVDLISLRATINDLTSTYTDGHHRGPALLVELADPASRVFTAHGSSLPTIPAGKPGSRPPVDLGHTDLLRLVEQRTYQHEADLLSVVPNARLEQWNTWHDLHSPTWLVILGRLPVLVLHVHEPEEDERVHELWTDVDRWRRTARQLLGYATPTSGDAPCTACGYATFVTAGGPNGEGYCNRNACDLSWKNAAQQSQALIDTEAACRALGIKPATLRGWKHKHLIRPAGGTVRKPLWRIDDLLVAQRGKPPMVPTQATVEELREHLEWVEQVEAKRLGVDA